MSKKKIKNKNPKKIIAILAIIAIIIIYIFELFIFLISGNSIFIIIQIILTILIIVIFKKKSTAIILLLILVLSIGIIFYIGSKDRSMLYFEKRKIISYLEKETNTKGFKITKSELNIRKAQGLDELFRIYIFDYKTYNIEMKTPDNNELKIYGELDSNEFLGLEKIVEQYKIIKQLNPYILEKYQDVNYNIYTYNSSEKTIIYVSENYQDSKTNFPIDIWSNILENTDYKNGINLNISIENKSTNEIYKINNGSFCVDKDCIPSLELDQIINSYYPGKNHTYEYGLNTQRLHLIKVYFNDFTIEDNQFYEEYKKWKGIEELATKIDGLNKIGEYRYYYLIYYKNTQNNYVILDPFTKTFEELDSDKNTIRRIYCNKDFCN